MYLNYKQMLKLCLYTQCEPNRIYPLRLSTSSVRLDINYNDIDIDKYKQAYPSSPTTLSLGF